jgi:hypothetical protein
LKTLKIVLLVFSATVLLGAPLWWYTSAEWEENDPDFPPGVRMNKEDYLRLRDEQIALLRGLDTAQQDSRTRAIREMERSERDLAARRGISPEAVTSWRALGPAPIPNGQTTTRTDPVSGRTVTLAVHPTNPNIVYAGAAQGGLYRSLNGGTTWTPLLDGALSLSMGSIAIAPSDPTTVYVGTGEAGFSGDSFFGVGVYRITNADSASPVITGPLNLDAGAADIFTGRAVGRVLVHPTDPNIIYVATVSGTSGTGGTTGLTLPPRGLYRSSNAMSGSPVFERLSVSASSIDRPILDAVFEPGDPNHMFVTLVDTTGNGDGGVYFSTNALAAVPAFTRLLTTGVGAELGRAELAIQRTGNTVTVYCAHGTGNGQISKTTYDTTAPGTPAFTLAVDNNFCNGQCFYDIAVAVDPTDPLKVYLAGSPTLPFGRSTNGGTSFTTSATGLHVDSHAIAVAPSDVNTIYYGSDGGVWKSVDAGLNWVSQNNTTYSATQFESVAVHPKDRHYTLGGTQDNGTEYLFPDGTTWTRSVGGDGGNVVIDSGSTTPTSLTSYHTFFNQTNSQIGFARSTTTQVNGNPIYGGLLGCGGTANGIACTDATLFYAPLVLGPNATGSTGNTVYFGSNKLYRSINQGAAMTVVSQTMPNTAGNERVSAIAIAPQNDDIRLIGSTTGRVYYSNTSGAVTMTDITGTIPARYVGRIVIDKTDANTAYVSLGGFGIPGQHVMKTTNLNAVTPTWTNSGSGIPDVPVNGLVIHPLNRNRLYAGTDIGVFTSIDGGANWTPFNGNLPRVAVFQIVIQPSRRILKIATHGKGIWENNLGCYAISAFSRDCLSDVAVFRPSTGVWYVLSSYDGSVTADAFGAPGDIIAPGDYDGDGTTDKAVFRPSTGVWYVQRSTAGLMVLSFGLNGDVPVQGDYDGDGLTDVAVWRPSTGVWYLLQSTAGFAANAFGSNGDKPVQGDYDGDGLTDVAIWRPSTGSWYLLRSSAGLAVNNFGLSGDRPVQADYDGDGQYDLAVWRPSDGTWYLLQSTAGFSATNFGLNGDIPAPGDYDGDAKTDFGIFRPSTGSWFLLRTTAGFGGTNFGVSGDVPVPAGYVPQ